MDDLRSQFAGDPIMDITWVRLAFCHLFLKDGKSAVKEIELTSPSLAERFKLLHRIIYSISFYLDNELDLAIHEIDNLLALIRSRPVENGDIFKRTVPYYKRFYKLVSNNTKQSKEDTYSKVLDEMKVTVKELKLRTLLLHVLWLERVLVNMEE